MKQDMICVILVVMLFFCGCNISHEKPISYLYDSSLSSRTVDRIVINEVQWAYQWAEYFRSKGQPPKGNGKLYDPNLLTCPLDGNARTQLACLLEKMHDNIAVNKTSDSEAFADEINEIETRLRGAESSKNMFLQKRELFTIAGLFEEYAQKKLIYWAEHNYKNTILGMLHPRSKGIIEDIVFEARPLSAGTQKKQRIFGLLANISEELSLSRTLSETTDVKYGNQEKQEKYEDGQPLLFEILYIINYDGVNEMFSAREDSVFDDPLAVLFLEPHKSLWLSGVPLRFVYFPKVIWINNYTQGVDVQGGKQVGGVKITQEDNEDKTLSFSFSPPIRALSDKNAFSFCLSEDPVKSSGKYENCGWERFWVIGDYYAAYKMKWDGNNIKVSPPFKFYKLPREKNGKTVDPNSNPNEELNLDEIKKSDPNGEDIYAIISIDKEGPKDKEGPNELLVRPLGFIKFQQKKEKESRLSSIITYSGDIITNSWNFVSYPWKYLTAQDPNISPLPANQLITYPYSLPDRNGKGELLLVDHPANNLRIRVKSQNESRLEK